MHVASQTRAQYGTFCAIDFETANYERDSACAVAIVRVERNRVVDEWSTLIRPRDGRVHHRFTQIHGITTSDVRDAPSFAEAWSVARRKLRGSRFLAAHNAPFDAGVLHACADQYGITVPSVPFLCTVRLARVAWNIRPTRLPDVAAALGLELDHHDARSDALACANIVTAWRRRTIRPSVQQQPERKGHRLPEKGLLSAALRA